MNCCGLTLIAPDSETSPVSFLVKRHIELILKQKRNYGEYTDYYYCDHSPYGTSFF